MKKLIFLTILFFLPNFVFAHGIENGEGSCNMMETMAGLGGWGMGFGLIFMLLFWILIIVGMIALIKWLVDAARGGRKNKSALNILEERYVKGEINKEEFEEKKKDL